MRTLALLAALVSVLTGAAVLSGCSSSSKTSLQVNKSVGEQLLDLQKAKESGTISDREYDRLRRKIVRDND